MPLEQPKDPSVEQILSRLNPPQEEAVTHAGGPLLVLAGAGSGKTRVITYRVAYLIAGCGVAPWNILAITFTNKAAGEIRERIFQLVPDRGEGVWISTFHAFCARILRIRAHLIGLERGFTIYDRTDQTTVVKQAMGKAPAPDKTIKPAALLNAISRAKTDLLSPGEYRSRAQRPFEESVAPIYEAYEEILKQNQALDFDDLLIYGVRLLSECDEAREHYQARFRHVLVDEYQDTNHPQYLLANILSEKYGNLCVVGDDDQSIYRWRGAQISNILEFGRDHPNVKVIRLERNYRSTKTILAAANAVVTRNRGRRGKKLWTNAADGKLIGVASLPDEALEGRWIANQIRELSGQYRWADIAAFYRINAQSRSIEEALRKENIPYTLVGGTSFYERKEIKDVLAYLRLMANPDDGISFARIANQPRRKLGPHAVDAILLFAGYREISVLKSCARAKEIDNLSALAKKSAKEFARLYQGWHQAIKRLSLEDLMKEVLQDSGYEEMLTADSDPQARSRWENVKELISAAAAFKEECELQSAGPIDTMNVLEAFLENLTLVSDVDEWEDREDAVVLMTLHSAKGLEFPVVFLTGLEEGLLPHSRSLNDRDQLEEERRLCYVGLTRAKARLFLTHAYTRRLFGPQQKSPTSRFLREIPDSCKEILPSDISLQQSLLDLTKTSRKRAAPEEILQRAAPPAEFKTGDTVRHRTFGLGAILEVQGRGPEARITVDFENFGERTLIQSYAKLRKE